MIISLLVMLASAQVNPYALSGKAVTNPVRRIIIDNRKFCSGGRLDEIQRQTGRNTAYKLAAKMRKSGQSVVVVEVGGSVPLSSGSYSPGVYGPAC